MWVRTDLSGMSDINQQMSWQTILDWQVEMFLYSCYLYYELDNPKLTDGQFDRIIDIMEAHFDELPDRITDIVGPGQIKANAHLFAHKLSNEEKENALQWKDRDL